METFSDEYIVNSIIDAAYKAAESRKWEVIDIKDWRDGPVNQENAVLKDFDEQHFRIKEERMPEGKLKEILKDKQTGKISQIVQ
jgi:hypothetical protein